MQLTEACKYEEDGYAFGQTMHDCPHKCSFLIFKGDLF